MSDLTDFLLARIAEDEADPWRGAELIGADRIVGKAEADALASDEREWVARVLRECEAKRRIVERATFDWQPDPLADSQEWGAFGEAEHICEILATVYADHPDHPDYREEWRVTT